MADICFVSAIMYLRRGLKPTGLICKIWNIVALWRNRGLVSQNNIKKDRHDIRHDIRHGVRRPLGSGSE